MIEYRKVGTFEDLVISHSDMLSLEIHPTLFRAKKQNTIDDEDTPSLERGDLLHLWLDRKDSFAIADIDKPTGKPGEMLDYFHKLIIKEEYKNNPDFAKFCAQDYSISMEVLQEYKNFYLGLYGGIPTEEQLRLNIAGFRFSRIEAEFGGIPGKKGAFGEDVIQSKIKEAKGIEYLRFLNNSRGKMVMTKATKNILVNCKASIDKHPLASAIVEAEGLSEYELFWEEEVEGIKIKRKAKIDKIIVDREKKILTVIDYKTMSFPVTQFRSEGSSYHKYKYERQLYSYTSAYGKKLFSEIDGTGWTINKFFVVVQTGDTYPTMVYKEPIRQEPKISLDNAMKRVAYHIKSNNWDLTMEEQMNGGYAQ
jgi:hypothetical protein